MAFRRYLFSPKIFFIDVWQGFQWRHDILFIINFQHIQLIHPVFSLIILKIFCQVRMCGMVLMTSWCYLYWHSAHLAYSLNKKMTFSSKDFLSKCDQIGMRIWLHLRKKSFMENFIFVHWFIQCFLWFSWHWIDLQNYFLLETSTLAVDLVCLQPFTE